MRTEVSHFDHQSGFGNQAIKTKIKLEKTNRNINQYLDISNYINHNLTEKYMCICIHPHTHKKNLL